MSIRNAEVERLAREQARLKGVSMTEAIRQALEAEAARLAALASAPKWDAARRERIMRIIAATAGLNFGDCVAYAVARVEGRPLLCKGADFAKTDVEVA